MLIRLGTVIHWTGFIVGCGYWALWSYLLLGLKDIANEGIVWAIWPLTFTVPNVAGWALDYVLTGRREIWPWKLK